MKIRIFTNKEWIAEKRPGFKFIGVLEDYKLSPINYQFIIKILKRNEMLVEHCNGNIRKI